MNITSLQHLINSINSVQEKIEASRLKVIYESKSNNIKSSECHLKFNKLMNKFSVFTEEYKFELDQFHKLLLNNITKITLKAQQDKINAQQAAIKAKLDAINNNNNEICTNLNAIENNSAAPSIKDDKSYSTHPPSPTPAQIKPKPKPKAKSNPKPKHNKKHLSARKNAKVHKPIYKKMQKPVYRAVSKPEFKDNDSNSVVSSVKSDYKPWVYRGQARSSTRIFIGNIPNDISEKTLAVHIARRARVDVKNIIEVQIRMGGKGKYALVRFNNEIDIHSIRKFMNKVNTENNDLFEKMKKESMKIKGTNGKNSNVSWKKRIYLRFHRNYNYNERNMNNTLYCRNFDILDENCYDELRKKLIESGGELMTEIKISVDRHYDPYCVVTFRDINDAEYCCTSEIEFHGRILEMRYYR